MLGIPGKVFLIIQVTSFTLSRVFTYSYYGIISFATIVSVSSLIRLTDISFDIMRVLNIIAVVYLSPKITEALKEYQSIKQEAKVK